MILHLLFDDKFGEYAVRQFSGSEMCSEFIVVTHSAAPDCSRKYKGVKIVFEDQIDFLILLQRLGEYKAIVFHGLFYPWQERVLRSVPKTVKVAWVFWGGDIYGRADIAHNYLSFTSKVLKWKQNLKRIAKGKKVFSRYEIPFELLKRIDYCLTDIPEDFIFVKGYLQSDIKELWYNYYSVEETVGDLMCMRCDGNNILMGNSSSLECNHIDGFKAIRRMNLSSSEKVFVPLSYGESWLRKEIIGKGMKMLGKWFCPLTVFQPRNEYNRIIHSCSTVVMPHYRPQAFGNILTALWMGARVFLSERNILFAYFKRIGTVVFSLEHDLRRNNPSALLPLTEDERMQNRKAILALYGKDVMRQKNLELVEVLNR
jgi:hypothetical protein